MFSMILCLNLTSGLMFCVVWHLPLLNICVSCIITHCSVLSYLKYVKGEVSPSMYADWVNEKRLHFRNLTANIWANSSQQLLIKNPVDWTWPAGLLISKKTQKVWKYVCTKSMESCFLDMWCHRFLHKFHCPGLLWCHRFREGSILNFA